MGTLYSQFSPFVDRLLGSGGSFAVRESNLKAQLDQAAEQREALTARLAQVEARYKKQFVALDGLLSKLSSTSQSLASQLATLPGA